MMIFLRVVCCVLGLTFVSVSWAADHGLIASEQTLQESYEAAVNFVKERNPSKLMDLRQEQDKWRDFRNEYCAKATVPDYCKANMNRKRARVLLGQHPSGKKQGASF